MFLMIIKTEGLFINVWDLVERKICLFRGLTFLSMIIPSWLCSLVVMSNMFPPSPGTMLYSTSAFFPMSRSWALIRPTAEPIAEDSGTRRWKIPEKLWRQVLRKLLWNFSLGRYKMFRVYVNIFRWKMWRTRVQMRCISFWRKSILDRKLPEHFPFILWTFLLKLKYNVVQNVKYR